MMAAESISEESKRPDLLVLKPSAVLSRLGLLEAVEGSRHCVACRSGRATGSDENNGSFSPTKRSFGRVSVGAPETEPPCMHHTTAPSLATCLAAPCLSHRSGPRLIARLLVTHLCGTPLAPAATSLRCKLLEESEPKLTETSIDGDALTLGIVSVGVNLCAPSH